MARRMAELGANRCYLDATMLGDTVEAIAAHFPTFVAACRTAGVSPDKEWVPVSPTTHYTMGGVLTDAEGRTTLEGLMAVGEVACTGLHGANRLASNSLLEGAVIGQRAADVILSSGAPVTPRSCVPLYEVLPSGSAPSARPGGGGRHDRHGPYHQLDHPVPLERSSLRLAMQAGAGIGRDADGLEQLARFLATARPSGEGSGPKDWERANMAQVAGAVVALAARRCESRGAQWRTDYPAPHAEWQVRQVAQLMPGGEMAVGNLPVPDRRLVPPDSRSSSDREPAPCPAAVGA